MEYLKSNNKTTNSQQLQISSNHTQANTFHENSNTKITDPILKLPNSCNGENQIIRPSNNHLNVSNLKARLRIHKLNPHNRSANINEQNQFKGPTDDYLNPHRL